MQQSGSEIIFKMIAGLQGQTSMDLRNKTGLPKSSVEYYIRKLIGQKLIVGITGGKRRTLYTVGYAAKNGITQPAPVMRSILSEQLLFNQLMGAI